MDHLSPREAIINYYEHHIGDYAEATAHLTFVEDAAYSRMIRKYYAQEKALPADIKAVQRLVGARSKEEREAVDVVLQEFFTLLGDGWHNSRCDAEIARYQDKQAKAKRSAEARWNKTESHTERNANASPNAMRTHTEGNAHQTPDTSHQTPDKDLKHRASTQPELSAGESVEATPATPVGTLSVTMRSFGIMSNPGDPRLMAIADQGVTAETVKAACEQAKRSKPNEPIGPAYVFAIVERWAKEAAELKATGATKPAAPGTTPPAPPRKPQGNEPKGTDESYEDWQARVDAFERAQRNGGKAA